MLTPALLVAGCAAEPAADNKAAYPVRIAPGLWEIRSAVTAARAPNLPILVRDRLVGPRPTRRLCVGAAQAEAARPGAPAGAIILERAYEPERYALRMELAERIPDGTILRLDIVTAGRRIGDC
jgi:hypothetical protein